MNKPYWFVFWSLVLAAGLVAWSPGAWGQETGEPVFRSLRFGDSQTEVRMKILEDEVFSVPMVNRGEAALSPKGEFDLEIESVQLDLVFFFNQAGLHRMDATGEQVSEDEYGSRLNEQGDVLKEVLETSFGDPTSTQRHEASTFDDGEFKPIAYWSPDHLEAQKEIWLGYNRLDDGFQLYLIVQDPERSDQPEYEPPETSPPTFDRDEAAELF